MSVPGARIGLFGGSFDPIHNGHILPVLAARESLGLDVVHYLPTACPPHKPQGTRRPLSCGTRWSSWRCCPTPSSSCRMPNSISGDPCTRSRRWSATRPSSRMPVCICSWASTVSTNCRLRRFGDLIEAVNLVVLARPGERGLDPEVRSSVESARGYVLVRHRAVDVSSSDIRRRLAQGEEVSADLMPGPVLRYCRKYGLYC